jgi:DNA-binding SARP family transcriptional activator
VSERKLSATLFGGFRLRSAAGDVRPRGRKTSGLLAYLIASDRRTASRARLADLLWSDRGEEQARSSLRQTVAELRGSPVADALQLGRADIGFAPDSVTSDIERIEAAAELGDAAALLAALPSLDGSLLDDLDGLSPAFDEWLLTERSRRREWLFATLLDGIAGLNPAACPEVAHLLAALERLDPLNEEVVRRRFQIDYEAGDMASLHRRYRRLSSDLSRELSVAPSRETRELFETLLRRDEHGAPPIAVAAPATADIAPTVRTPPIVLVSPFASDGSAEAARIAAIVTEDVEISLARNAELRVLMTALADPQRLASALDAAVSAYMLRGSARAIDGRTAINVQLASMASGLVVWSDRLWLGPDQHIDEDVVARIAGAAGPAIERDLAAAYAGRDPLAASGEEVAALYARGRQIARDARTLDAARAGAALLEQVVARDPRHVGARLRLAQLYNTDFHYLVAGHDQPAFREHALRLATEAADIEPTNVRVQLRLAWCRLRQGEWAYADRLFRAAEAAMPHDADAINECGFGLAQLGELHLARTLIQRAFQLNPFAPAEYHADFAVLLALSGEGALAEEHFEICGEQRLFYQVIRLGNLQRLDRERPQLLALRRRFVETFLDIWEPSRPPTIADARVWINHTFCLRHVDHARLILEGVERAWADYAPEARDNSRSTADAGR